MTARKPEDKAAAQIEFGVELETFIPAGCGINVGQYHMGNTVTRGTGQTSVGFIAPAFEGRYWKAERDASIVADEGCVPCEFVSPVLKGETGVIALRDFVRFAVNIGAKVNGSCGCHVTIGLKSITGSGQPEEVRRYLRRLVRVANKYAWAIYAQTGTNRHENIYAKRLPRVAGELTNELLRPENSAAKEREKLNRLAYSLGRGMVNCLKAFPNEPSKSAVEFRAFAGTLNEKKVLHHVATCLGIARRAATAKVIPHFDSRRKPEDAPAALREMWQNLGWLDDMPGLDCALGQFGILYSEFPAYSETAMKMAKKFEQKHPEARL